MNPLEPAYQLRRIYIDSTVDSDAGSCTSAASSLASNTQEFELDSSGFDGMMSSPSYALSSSFNSMSLIPGNGLSRNRGVQNLSALHKASPVEGTAHSRRVFSNPSGPNATWGYFADTTSK